MFYADVFGSFRGFQEKILSYFKQLALFRLFRDLYIVFDYSLLLLRRFENSEQFVQIRQLASYGYFGTWGELSLRVGSHSRCILFLTIGQI